MHFSKYHYLILALTWCQLANECILGLNAFSIEKSIAEKSDSTSKYKGTSTSNLLKKCDPCPDNIICVPKIQCPAHVRMKKHEKPQMCDLEGQMGFCCTTGQNHTEAKISSARAFAPPNILPVSVVEDARLKFENLMNKVSVMAVKRGNPDFLHGIAFHSSAVDDNHSFQLSNTAIEQIITSQIFSQQEQIPLDDIITNNINVNFAETSLAFDCNVKPNCRIDNIYRTFDGSCNNPHHLNWGAAGQPMERLLPPAYDDGIWTPRLHSIDGTLLRGARDISRHILLDKNSPHAKYNLLLMQFGQFIAHDVTQSSSIRLEGGELIECCAPNGESVLPPEKSHFACLPIHISPDDEFYGPFKVRCLNFVRLSLAPACHMRYGKQRSKVTHFLDGSAIYGSSAETARELRTFRGGKLRMFHDFGRDLLPLTNDKKACESDDEGKICFKSGDGRTNQIISLIVMHILFAREHNRIADILSNLNPQYSDEKLFQEARRIVIAELQHITFNEYLPSVIGSAEMKRFRLFPQGEGHSKLYDININPAITNEFSGAAFRMGHSTVDGKFYIHKENSFVDEVINIPDTMFNPSRMRRVDFFNNMLQSLIKQPMQKVDSYITYGLSRFMFRGHQPYGLDLAAFNIQRGRDQGLRTYNDYLELIGKKRIESFNQFPSESGQKLAQVYNNPEDIDLWIGGLQEKSVEDGIVGYTFAEIIADQFSRLKHGDRYYYEYNNDINPGAFTIKQLNEIRKTSMARLICDNADRVGNLKVSQSAFVRSDLPGNNPTDCEQIPSLNLFAWRKR